MIAGTALRQGRILAAKRPSALMSGVGGCDGSSIAAPFTSALQRCVECATASEPRQRQARSLSAAPSLLPSNFASGRRYATPSIDFRHRLYHASAISLQPEAAVKTSDDCSTTSHNDRALSRALSPAIRSAIIADLRSVDFDGNGRIDADELKVLLKRHNDSFTEAEILELSELFYTSLGAGGVDIDRFLEALDAAAAAENGTGVVVGDISPLATKGTFKTHPLGIGTCASEYMYAKTHGAYSQEDLNIELTHVEPATFSDKTALFAVKCVRFAFDTATLWNVGSVTKEKILNRAIFLETIAAIPGMVAAIIRHFRSLRNMARDGGMLNMFLEEANNERMHLLTFIRMKEPGYLFRASVISAQFGFGSFFLTAYMINPAWCHRFVGYIEEEACHTYTKILDEMDRAPEGSELALWKDEGAPKIAKGYWHLGEGGTVYDVMMAVRADEAEHRDVNHAVSGVPEDTVNPLYDPRVKLDGMLRKYVEDVMQKEAGKGSSAAGVA